MTLTQGKMSVLEYEKQFTTLSGIATTFVQIDEARCKKFQWGLDYPIQTHLSAFELTSYSALVNKALVVERDVQELEGRCEQFKKGSFDSALVRGFQYVGQTSGSKKQRQQFFQARGAGYGRNLASSWGQTFS